MRTSNFALRLQPTLLEEARAMAKEEGVALNQLINVAVAERLAVSRTLEFFANYTRDADVAGAREILARAGTDNPPMRSDELPELQSLVQRRAKRADVQAALEILRRPKKGEPPREGDELPKSWARRHSANGEKQQASPTRSK